MQMACQTVASQQIRHAGVARTDWSATSRTRHAICKIAGGRACRSTQPDGNDRAVARGATRSPADKMMARAAEFNPRRLRDAPIARAAVLETSGLAAHSFGCDASRFPPLVARVRPRVQRGFVAVGDGARARWRTTRGIGAGGRGACSARSRDARAARTRRPRVASKRPRRHQSSWRLWWQQLPVRLRRAARTRISGQPADAGDSRRGSGRGAVARRRRAPQHGAVPPTCHPRLSLSGGATAARERGRAPHADHAPR